MATRSLSDSSQSPTSGAPDGVLRRSALPHSPAVSLHSQSGEPVASRFLTLSSQEARSRALRFNARIRCDLGIASAWRMARRGYSTCHSSVRGSTALPVKLAPSMCTSYARTSGTYCSTSIRTHRSYSPRSPAFSERGGNQLEGLVQGRPNPRLQRTALRAAAPHTIIGSAPRTPRLRQARTRAAPLRAWRARARSSA